MSENYKEDWKIVDSILWFFNCSGKIYLLNDVHLFNVIFFFKMLVFFQKTLNSLSERVCLWTNQIRNLKIKVGGMECPRLCHTLTKSKNCYVGKIQIMKNNKSRLNYCFSMCSLWIPLFHEVKDNAVWQLSLPRADAKTELEVQNINWNNACER